MRLNQNFARHVTGDLWGQRVSKWRESALSIGSRSFDETVSESDDDICGNFEINRGKIIVVEVHWAQ